MKIEMISKAVICATSPLREKVPEEVSGKREEINFRLVDDETLEVSGYGEWKEVDDQYWYEYDEKNKYQIRTLIVKEGITKISLAGTRMEYVQEIFLPDSVKEIGERAFWGFSNLRRVSFGNGLKKIGKGAFEGCQFLKQAFFKFCPLDGLRAKNQLHLFSFFFLFSLYIFISDTAIHSSAESSRLFILLMPRETLSLFPLIWNSFSFSLI